MNPSSSENDDEFESLLSEAEKFLEEFKHRKIYAELTPKVMANIPDEHLVRAVIDHIGCRIGEDWENDLAKVPTLGPYFVAVYFLVGFNIEWNNGGFNQFFYNRGREAVVQAKEGAELLGLEAVALENEMIRFIRGNPELFVSRAEQP